MAIWFVENLIAIVALVFAIIGVMVSTGFFVRNKRDVKDPIYIEQEREEFRRKLVEAKSRLGRVDLVAKPPNIWPSSD